MLALLQQKRRDCPGATPALFAAASSGLDRYQRGVGCVYRSTSLTTTNRSHLCYLQHPFQPVSVDGRAAELLAHSYLILHCAIHPARGSLTKCAAREPT
ncbi:hypothetical protein GQ53DRAFT_90283 [Thozetella sp. PMI_491]|nr:hypothetical protein GQ53DRAFT_90283 [Thozetella sp. PMI_491]